MPPVALLSMLAALPQAGIGIVQYLNAIKNAKKNVRPTYKIDPSYQTAIDTLESNQGLPQSAISQYSQNANNGLTQGISAIEQTGGNGNQISGFVNDADRNFQKVLVQDALTKKNDIGGILTAMNSLAEQKDKAFQINEYSPFADRATAIAQEKNAGLQNIFGSLNSISGGLANAATSKISDTTQPTINTTASGAPVNGVDYSAIIRSFQPTGSFGGQGGFSDKTSIPPEVLAWLKTLNQDNFNSNTLFN